MSESDPLDWLQKIAAEDQPNFAPRPETSESRPTHRLVFRPPTLGQYFRKSILVIVMALFTSITLTFSVLLVIGTSPGSPPWLEISLVGIFLFVPLIVLSLNWIWVYLLAERGRVILMEDRLLEFNVRGQRELAYDQIYETAALFHQGQTRCRVRFYPRGPLGEIDYLDLHWTFLIAVSNPQQLAEALRLRITGLPPTREAKRRELKRQTIFYATFLGGGLLLLLFMGLDKFVLQNFAAWHDVWVTVTCMAWVGWLASLFIIGGLTGMGGS